MYILMEHIDGKVFRILVPIQKAKDVCPAHKLAMALNLNLGAIVHVGLSAEDCHRQEN